MAAENYIRVPKEYGRVLGRMGLAEFKVIQENENNLVISAPIEYCRLLKRMGGEFKGVTDSDYIFRKATACADTAIEDIVLANQSYIERVSQTGNDCSIEVQYYKLQDLTSPETGLTKKYLCFLVRTNLDTIEGATWNGSALTSKDVQDSIDMGGTAQDLCWWVAAEDILDSIKSGTIAKEGYTTESISITATDVTEYNVSVTNSENNTALLTVGANSIEINAGATIQVQANHGDEIILSVHASEGYLINGYTINGSSSSIEPASSDNIIRSATGDLTILVSTEAEGGIEGEYLQIINNSSADVEIYYEEDKEEKGNQTVSAGGSATVSIDRNYPYFLRYSEGGSGNGHYFEGRYHSQDYPLPTSINYYDGNICPPEESHNTEWSFYEGDYGTLTITGGGSDVTDDDNNDVVTEDNSDLTV